MAVHGSEDGKPIACRHCDKRFLNNSALACHLKVFTFTFILGRCKKVFY